MPDQHCPACGAVRTAGSCGCSSDLSDTAVLPHIEGPPLVRPYVPRAVGQVGAEPGTAPGHDAFGATGASPATGYDDFGGRAGAGYRTTLMPPAPASPPPYGSPPPQPGPAPDELGLFAFDHAIDAPPQAPGAGQAGRRREQQSPLARRRGAILAAGAGVVVLGVGAAFLASPSGSPDQKALPSPTAVLTPTLTAPTDLPSAGPPSPSAAPSGSGTAAPSPSRTAKPTKAPTTAPATTEAAPPAPAAPAPTTPAGTPSPSPSPSATVRILERDMKGDDVKLMQQLLVTESCGTVDKSLISGTFDWWTEFVLKSFQDSRKPSLKSESGKYGPRTKAALETAPPDC
ncbi:hypothetical protein GCM10018781_39430 [Kitasatospora indigofera]|uniref:Peptidoglycan binding-like domain-containing protein n=1 Tax=Kitasatospora indigofera TaxID=67307 RepID=A0A919FWU6_9ACTN|nr:peptidoglycan-binding domain-containing protein [Kitasatospora indigofera]GHH73898.1 hypothetical protein GCM10018781_39430 [Kitasatospora indigofera]